MCPALYPWLDPPAPFQAKASFSKATVANAKFAKAKVTKPKSAKAKFPTAQAAEGI